MTLDTDTHQVRGACPLDCPDTCSWIVTVRFGPKGSGAFVRISWDEALETIAARLREVIDTHGAEAIWPFLGSGNMGLIQGAYGAGRRLWNVLGASRHMQTIACVNLANLMLTRASGRRKEIALQLALGSSRSNVARQCLIEALLVGAAGGTLHDDARIWNLFTDRGRCGRADDEEVRRHRAGAAAVGRERLDESQ